MTKNVNNISSVTYQDCCGCAACVDLCPKNAISMSTNQTGEMHPFVDTKKCINCGKCLNTCQGYKFIYNNLFEKKTFVSTYDNVNAMQSSSGGIFYLLARYILNKGGVVYGAAMVYEDNFLSCKHIRIDNIEYIYKLQGSKYVQSLTEGIFNQVKLDLKCGKIVLFSGTSCQVASLQRFVGNNSNLFTIDLICHGVPKNRIFDNYICYIEETNKCKVHDISFRKKGMTYMGHPTSLYLTVKAKSLLGKSIQYGYYVPESPFYSLYMRRCGYREACYSCKYASLNKPGDITLGDFFPTDYDIEHYGIDCNKNWSSIIINSEKGFNLFTAVKNKLNLYIIPTNSMMKHHHNLQSPSKPTILGKFLYATYLIGGYTFLRKILYLLERRERMLNLFKKIKIKR